jgi:hypothetical protein
MSLEPSKNIVMFVMEYVTAWPHIVGGILKLSVVFYAVGIDAISEGRM